MRPGARYLLSSAHIAQLVEHFLGKEEVTGSNPVMGSNARRTFGMKSSAWGRRFDVKGEV